LEPETDDVVAVPIQQVQVYDTDEAAHSTVVTRLAKTWQDAENGFLSVANAIYN